MSGLSKKQLIHRYLFDAILNESDENKQQLIDSFNHVIANKQVHRISRLRYDIVLPDGESAGQQTERHWAAINTPIFDDAGEVEFILNQPESVKISV